MLLLKRNLFHSQQGGKLFYIYAVLIFMFGGFIGFGVASLLQSKAKEDMAHEWKVAVFYARSHTMVEMIALAIIHRCGDGAVAPLGLKYDMIRNSGHVGSDTLSEICRWIHINSKEAVGWYNANVLPLPIDLIELIVPNPYSEVEV